MTQEPAYVREERRMAAMRAVVAEPYTLGSITVTLDGDAWNWDFNAPYIRGTCSQCGATVVQAASSRQSMRSLALAIAYTWCKQRNHVQDYAALLATDAPQFPEGDD